MPFAGICDVVVDGLSSSESGEARLLPPPLLVPQLLLAVPLLWGGVGVVGAANADGVRRSTSGPVIVRLVLKSGDGSGDGRDDGGGGDIIEDAAAADIVPLDEWISVCCCCCCSLFATFAALAAAATAVFTGASGGKGDECCCSCCCGCCITLDAHVDVVEHADAVVIDDVAESVTEIGIGVAVSHIFGDSGAKRSGDEVEVSATDSPSLLHLESIFRRFSFRS